MSLGLKGRAIALCALLLLGTVAVLSTALIWLNYRDSMRSMREHAIADAKVISYAAELAVLLNDAKALEHVIAAALQEETVCDVKIADVKGKIIASRCRPSHRPSSTAAQSLLSIAGQWRRGQTRLTENGRQLLVLAPVWAQRPEIDLGPLEDEVEHAAQPRTPIGYVALAYALDPIWAEFVDRLVSVVIVAIVVVGVGVAVTFVAVRQLLRPLKNLVDTTDAIARGDRSKRATEQAVGEIGELARSFNFMADRLQESHSSIERKVAERTAELQARSRELEREIRERERAEAELRRAKDGAEAANRAKSDFLANMSHEIRTPMTAILGFAEALLDPDMSESDRLNAINTIRRNGDHLLAIINDVLDISKIEAGKLEPERLCCSPSEVIREVESLMRPRAEARDLSFGIEFLTPLPETIRTDPTRLRQILINLMGNAVKFTEKGGVKLVTRLLQAGAETAAAAPMLRFDVVDTGIGMAPEQVERAFQSFSQADETMSRRFGGTGLGLAISRHLATILGGEITVKSELNKGSTFSVTIATGPLDDVRLIDPKDQPPIEESSDSTSGVRESSIGKLACRVLLVEDGPDNQRLISFVLRKAGAEVVIAENGRAGVDAAIAAWQHGQPFDVVLMDMQMPVLDGYAATSLLRRKGYRHPVVALTAHAMSTDRNKCLNAGCNDYMAKPIDRQKLLELVAYYMRRAAENPPDDTPPSVRASSAGSGDAPH